MRKAIANETVIPQNLQQFDQVIESVMNETQVTLPILSYLDEVEILFEVLKNTETCKEITLIGDDNNDAILGTDEFTQIWEVLIEMDKFEHVGIVNLNVNDDTLNLLNLNDEKNMTTLKSLNLSNNKITKDGLNKLYDLFIIKNKFSNVTSLNLSGNLIDDKEEKLLTLENFVNSKHV
ncbi:hypothetical protein ABK040_005343 [Willaertia magna]